MHEPGDSQRADLGTKPLPAERLRHLVSLWGMMDAGVVSPRVSRFSSSPTTTAPTTSITSATTWLQSLVAFCTWCSTRAQEMDQLMVPVDGTYRDHVVVQIPWEFYIMVIVVIVGVFGCGNWQGLRGQRRSQGFPHYEHRHELSCRRELKWWNSSRPWDPDHSRGGKASGTSNAVQLQEESEDYTIIGNSTSCRTTSTSS